ncbi:MAG: hypothetical protein IJZ14_02875 [Oscillospiraceae bacterium]|nr:hypothetical protein [Oscillospiraceae bacterium]
MNTLQAGFSRVNITPALGTEIVGYFQARYAEGVLDELEINALALSAGEDKVVLMSADLCFIGTAVQKVICERICAATGLTADQIFVHSTHTHTGPVVNLDGINGMQVSGVDETKQELAKQYGQLLCNKFADAAVMALKDMKPAKMGYAVGNAPNIAFVRRFRMKDGKVRTNPGVGNPDILHPIGDVDERVNVLRFDREGGDTIVLANMGCHPDVVGGSLISGDWPTLFRHRLEKTLDNVKGIFFNGAQGDVNHVNVNAKGGDFNDMFNDFDDVARGYGHARHMANVMTAAVLQVFDKVNYVDVDRIRSKLGDITVPSNMPKPEDLPLARKYDELHKAGRDTEIPFEGMELTTVVAEAARMVKLEHGPESFPMTLSAVAIGNVALAGVPGEPFNGIGLGLKKAEGWDLVLPCCLTNGSEGYFPMQDSYDEGGYEARSSRFKAGTAEIIIKEGVALLDSLR